MDQKEICPKGKLTQYDSDQKEICPKGKLTQNYSDQKEICPKGKLSQGEFALKEICPKGKLSQWKSVPSKFIIKENFTLTIRYKGELIYLGFTLDSLVLLKFTVQHVLLLFDVHLCKCYFLN